MSYSIVGQQFGERREFRKAMRDFLKVEGFEDYTISSGIYFVPAKGIFFALKDNTVITGEGDPPEDAKVKKASKLGTKGRAVPKPRNNTTFSYSYSDEAIAQLQENLQRIFEHNGYTFQPDPYDKANHVSWYGLSLIALIKNHGTAKASAQAIVKHLRNIQAQFELSEGQKPTFTFLRGNIIAFGPVRG